MDETFFVVSVMAVSFEIYKTDDKNKVYFKCFFSSEVDLYKNIFFLLFNFGVKKVFTKEFIYSSL